MVQYSQSFIRMVTGRERLDYGCLLSSLPLYFLKEKKFVNSWNMAVSWDSRVGWGYFTVFNEVISTKGIKTSVLGMTLKCL